MEYLDVVDSKDNVIAKETREKVHKYGMRHREVHVFVINSKDEILLQKRSEYVDYYPGFWDISLGEHVKSGEGYKDAAARGIKEELGFKPKALKFYFDTESQNQNVFRKAFICHHEGKFKIDKKEVGMIEFFSTARIKSEIKKGKMKFTDGFKISFEGYLKSKG
jgi:isopentenyldiphosphate isomerase